MQLDRRVFLRRFAGAATLAAAGVAAANAAAEDLSLIHILPTSPPREAK